MKKLNILIPIVIYISGCLLNFQMGKDNVIRFRKTIDSKVTVSDRRFVIGFSLTSWVGCAVLGLIYLTDMPSNDTPIDWN